MSESKTPRSDAEEFEARHESSNLRMIAVVDADFARTLESEVSRLQAEKAEVERERDEARAIIAQHDLCHNLHGKVDAIAFAEGCEGEQRKLYGCAPHADRATAAESALKQAEIRARNADHSACFLFTDRLKALLAKERGCGECWKGQRCGNDCHMKDVTT